MAASAHLLLSAFSKREEFADYEPHLCDFGSGSTWVEAPLTSEPPLPDFEPLTSEPPLADATPLTSEAAALEPDTTRP